MVSADGPNSDLGLGHKPGATVLCLNFSSCYGAGQQIWRRAVAAGNDPPEVSSSSHSLQTASASSAMEPYNAAARLLTSTYQIVAPLVLLALTYAEAHAQTRGGLESSPPL